MTILPGSLIQVSLSDAFYNKELRFGQTKAAFSHSFIAKTVTVDQLLQHIVAGNAWSPSTFLGNHRRKVDDDGKTHNPEGQSYWLQSQCLVLDFDDHVSVEDCENNELIDLYAALIHATPTSTDEQPRTRVVFILDQPIIDLTTYEQLGKALLWQVGYLNPDDCSEGARFFYGSDKPGFLRAAQKRLPLGMAQGWIDQLPKPEEPIIVPFRPAPQPSAGDNTTKYCEAAYQDELAVLAAATKGTRNNTLFRVGVNLMSMARGNWPGIDEARVLADLRQTCPTHEGMNTTINSILKRAQPRPLPQLEQRPAKPNGNRPSTFTTLPAMPNVPLLPPGIVTTTKDAHEDFTAFLTGGKSPSEGEIVPVPFQQFHELGGFARWLLPMKLSAIMAQTGDGKTTFVETWVDFWLRKGYDILHYSPEWDAFEQHWQRVHRNGGATYDQLLNHWVYQACNQNGVSPVMGSPLPGVLLQHSLGISQKIAAWPGQLYGFSGVSFTEEILAKMTEQLTTLRQQKRRVGVAVFDYIQLMRTSIEETGHSTYETMLNLIKDFSERQHIHCVVAIQVLKSVARLEKLLDSYDAQWVRPDAFNLIVTLNFPQEPDPQQPGEKRRTIMYTNEPDPKDRKPLGYCAIANICKNSKGREGKIKLLARFDQLRWVDQSWERSPLRESEERTTILD